MQYIFTPFRFKFSTSIFLTMKTLFQLLFFTVLSLFVTDCKSAYFSGDKVVYDNVRIDSLDNIIVYYPNFENLEMAYGSNVPNNDDILYCCGAAFTAECLKSFNHENIRCNHVNKGRFYHGSDEPICNGAFTFYDGQGHFDRINDSVLHVAADHGGMGFCQVLTIFDGEIAYTDTLNQDFWIHKDYVFRALCEKDGKLCIIETKAKVPYGTFAHYLKDFGVTYAINLDMGGWSHAWYRDNYGEVIETNSAPCKWATNWLLFKAKRN